MNKIIRLIRVFVLGLKQFQAANKLEIANTYLCEIEAGRKAVPLSLIKKYSVMTGIPVSKIMLLAEKENPERIFSESVKKTIKKLT